MAKVFKAKDVHLMSPIDETVPYKKIGILIIKTKIDHYYCTDGIKPLYHTLVYIKYATLYDLPA